MTKGEKIRNLRERMGMQQVTLADKIDVSKQTLYKYENDIVTNIPSDKIEALADVLHTTPAYLMGWEEAEPYYLNSDTAEIAQELFDNPDMRILFDAARDSRPEDLRMVADMLKRFKETNP